MTFPHNPAQTEAGLLSAIAERWSPRIFTDQPLKQQMVDTLFEAARWAPSSYNEQPWRYVYAQKGEEGREQLESLLLEGNAWAKSAPLLLISFYKRTSSKNGKENRVALHDLGASNISLALQATHMGLLAHQMGGFRHADANAELSVPEDFYPGSMMAVGYPAQDSEITPRERKSLEEIVFHGKWSG